ncbi:MAG: GNAT family N-acetyltransferase [Flavobacteriales bacterium]|nr:GNAT family N-acetyltransferase [Flavobacteriales bacterium]MCB9167813.1 GNAT family N-acetyltransferase [Flavobacteriales bacterium]
MITLQHITTSARMEEYHRFRHRIYRNSVQAGFLSDESGVDRDAYDANAIHLGWYAGEELRGCVRFIRPISGPQPLYCLTHMPVEAARQVCTLMSSYLEQGLPFVEVSRICIDPAYRDLATVKEFTLTIMAMSHVLGLDQAVFTCLRPHMPFWRRMGFSILGGAEGFSCTRSLERSYAMMYRHAELPLAIREQLPTREDRIRNMEKAA